MSNVKVKIVGPRLHHHTEFELLEVGDDPKGVYDKKISVKETTYKRSWWGLGKFKKTKESILTMVGTMYQNWYLLPNCSPVTTCRQLLATDALIVYEYKSAKEVEETK